MDALWERLPPEVRDRIDAELRQRRELAAIVILRRDGGLEPVPGLHEAQHTVWRRMRRLDERGEVPPERAVGVPEMLDRARAIPDRVVAVESVWDGDTQGWYVYVVAIVERPGRYHPRYDEVVLATIRRGGDIRLFNGTVPPWPEAADGARDGAAVAAALGVPFVAADPEPELDPPRWWDTAPG